MRRLLPLLSGLTLIAGSATATAALAAPGARTHPVVRGTTFTSRVFASGARITHMTARGRVAVTQPDDLTQLGGRLYVAFQNGVGPQGQPSPSGNADSTIVEFGRAGRRLAQWDIAGHCDGLTADPRMHWIIATVNEDAHSSLTVIGTRGGLRHYRYARRLPSRGGTDAISIDRGSVLISASAPGTSGAAAPRPSYPAVYRATFHARTRTVSLRGLFGEEAPARIANAGPRQGSAVHLALTDPDSNAVVPAWAHRFAGDFMLDSQGDEEQIFRSPAGGLSVLKLSASVNDTAWPSAARGTLYVSDGGGDTIDAVTGPFVRGSAIAAVTPCDANAAPSVCPARGYPANHLGTIDPRTGRITPLAVRGHRPDAQGLLFVG
ncbi:MAG TPA: hypothetical protein VFN65_07360 [Solirubrobacteraceae bacterium]|nr:hypothetical protein [Solirubrobacteraceae bacterium]